jgi:hypothetical protein
MHNRARRLALLHTCLGKSLWVARPNYEFCKAWERFAAIIGKVCYSGTQRLRPPMQGNI